MCVGGRGSWRTDSTVWLDISICVLTHLWLREKEMSERMRETLEMPKSTSLRPVCIIGRDRSRVMIYLSR